MPNLDRLARLLRPGGLILFATDFFDYYLHTKLLFSLHPELVPGDDTVPEESFLSVFAKRFEDLGKTVRTLSARRSRTLSGSPDATGPGSAPGSR